MKNRERVVYEVEIAIGRERVSLRLLTLEALILLERELTQADGTSFTHSISVDSDTVVYDYITADPYFLQLERHYSAVQERIREIRWQRG